MTVARDRWTRRRGRPGFTLVEILIVVVILGILAALVVPQFTEATDDAASKSALHELQKLRRAIDVYRVRNENELPDVQEGVGTWGPIVGNGDYLKSAPVNPWVGPVNSAVIVFGNAPDQAYQTAHGWIYDPDSGAVWAGSFDANDNPLPK